MDSKQGQQKELLKKIGRYTTAAGAALLTGNLANAGTLTTSSVVDLTYGSHYIDLDGDGHNDVSITVYTSDSSTVWVSIETLGSADMTVSVMDNGPFCPGHHGDPGALPLNWQIGPTLVSGSYWTEPGETIAGTESGSDLFDGNFDYYQGQTRYMGMRYSKDHGTTWYYGWMAIKINNFSPSNPLLNQSSAGQILGWAFSGTPNTSVPAGAGSAVPVLPIASALGLGLAGLFGFMRNRRKKAIVE